MKLQLKSNFIDYYDHQFDLTGLVFSRMNNGGMNRGRMFGFMRHNGINVPIYGLVQHLKTASYFSNEDQKVVVYLNENVHCGEGKELITLKEAVKKYPYHLCTEYLEEENNVFRYGISYRHLQIGNRAFWLRYVSYNDWRSNCGDGDIDFLEEVEPIILSIDHLLFAIDFVKSNGQYYAIDFNASPGIKGTGVENILSPKDVVDLIKQKQETINIRRPII